MQILDEEKLTTSEIAARLRFSSAYIRQLADRGEIPHFRINHELRFSPSAVAQWLDERRRGPQYDQA